MGCLLTCFRPKGGEDEAPVLMDTMRRLFPAFRQLWRGRLKPIKRSEDQGLNGVRGKTLAPLQEEASLEGSFSDIVKVKDPVPGLQDEEIKKNDLPSQIDFPEEDPARLDTNMDKDYLESSATAEIEVKIRGEDVEACVAASVGDHLSGTSVKSESTISATSEKHSSPPSLGSGSGTLEKQKKKKKSRKSFRKSFRESFRKKKVARKNNQEGEGLDD